MTINDIRQQYGLTMKALSDKLHIPYRTVQSWCGGERACPPYVVELIAFRLAHDDNTESRYSG